MNPKKSPEEAQPLYQSVSKALTRYFDQLEGQSVTGVYDMVLAEVEKPLLQAAMVYVGYNQCKAAVLLGINRGTLRKKLQLYAIKKPNNTKRTQRSRVR